MSMEKEKNSNRLKKGCGITVMPYTFNHAPLLQWVEALNHNSQKTTLRSIGIQQQEIASLYKFET